MDIVLATPRGFCAGVKRAIDIVDLALKQMGAPIYVFHEIVHNHHVVADLKSRGAIFVNDLSEVPPGAHTIYSAHGVSHQVRQQAKRRELRTLDATCPLVTKVHLQAQRFEKQGMHLVMVGHAGHEEVEGTVGSVSCPVHLVSSVEEVALLPWPSDAPVAYVTQTTLSMDDTRDILQALHEKYPEVTGPDMDGICYATQNRQNAVRDLAKDVDLVLVVGARNSSNSNRLREVAERCGKPAYLVQDRTELQPAWWADGVQRIGVTSGASTPEVLVQQVVLALSAYTSGQVHEAPGVVEHVVFRLPKALEPHATPHTDPLLDSIAASSTRLGRDPPSEAAWA